MALRFTLVRPDDLLNLRVHGENLRLDATDPQAPVLTIDDQAQPGILVLEFPPQTIVEEAVYESAGEPSTPPSDTAPPTPTAPKSAAPGTLMRSRIAGPSRLVFEVPAGRTIPYTIAGLLDWAGLGLRVSPLADVPAIPTAEQIAAAPGIAEPDELHTALELPYRLILSPAHDVGWRHNTGLSTAAGRTEMWHTMLGRLDADGGVTPASKGDPIPLRAIWSDDYRSTRFYNTDQPQMGAPDQDWDINAGGVLTAMTPSDRHEIVILTSAFRGFIKGNVGGMGQTDYSEYVPSPVQADQLILSPLGGYLHSRGGWSPPRPWRYRRPRIIEPGGGRVFDDLNRVLERPHVGPVDPVDPLIDPDPGPIRRLLAPRIGQQLQPGPIDAPHILAEGAAGIAERIAPNVGANRIDPNRIGEDVGANRIDPNRVGDNIGIELQPDIGIELDPNIGVPILMQKVYGDSLNLSEWVHSGSQGRDHYVRIVYEGYLYPFRNRAALVKVTERKVRNAPNGRPVAYLAQRNFIVIRQPQIDYADDRADLPHARSMPIHQVRFATVVTPDINNPLESKVPGTEYSFLVRVGGTPFRFNAVAADIAGNAVDFTATAYFIPFSDATPDSVKAVRAAHLASAERTCLVPAKRMAFAQPDPAATTDNATFVTTSFDLTTDDINDQPGPGGGRNLAYRFRPLLFKAAVHVPAIEQLLGRDGATTIAYEANYLASGFGGANATGLFARIAKEGSPKGTMVADVLRADFAADQAGGVATPNMQISSITRQLGPMAGSDLAKIASNVFDPAAFFAGIADAKLFGTIPLTALLQAGGLDVGAPTVQTHTEPIDAVSKRLVAQMHWQPKVQNAGVGIVRLITKPSTAFTIDGRVEQVVVIPPNGAPPPASSRFTGHLAAFDVQLLEVVAVHVKDFRFTSISGHKPNIDIALEPEPVSFEGELTFVNELQKAIPPGLFGDGAILDINTQRIRAGFAIGLPAIAIGVFALDGVALSAAVELPFANGQPVFDFGVSSREHPFCLTVAFLGGGGFFHLQLDTGGIKLLEAALEFGAQAAIDLGVASGGVHIMAGIYFAMGKKNGDDWSILSGYLRMGGELSVLGLISISLEFVLSFGYEAGKAAGRATLTVKVEVAFFSTSVELSVEKKFGGSSGDPRFVEVIESPSVWDEYAGAFAA